MSNNKLSDIITSYLEVNHTNPRQLAKKINAQVGMPNAINYNTIYYWSKGRTQNPYSASVVLPLLRERGDDSLRELADAILKELENGQPVQG
jgi:hypothetical protein